MNDATRHSAHVLYVTDAYCGWCFGFSPQLQDFEARNRRRVPFKAISGGLFVGPRVGPIGAYPHIPEANARIARLTGVHFGERYDELVREGRFVMNSEDAAAGLAALRAQDAGRSIRFAHLLQHAFYVEGRSLSDPQTIGRIAEAEGLDAAGVCRMLADGSAHVAAQADFAMARELGATTYPTLLFVDGDQVHRLPATGADPAVRNGQLDALLNRSAVPTA